MSPIQLDWFNIRMYEQINRNKLIQSYVKNKFVIKQISSISITRLSPSARTHTCLCMSRWNLNIKELWIHIEIWKETKKKEKKNGDFSICLQFMLLSYTQKKMCPRTIVIVILSIYSHTLTCESANTCIGFVKRSLVRPFQHKMTKMMWTHP